LVSWYTRHVSCKCFWCTNNIYIFLKWYLSHFYPLSPGSLPSDTGVQFVYIAHTPIASLMAARELLTVYGPNRAWEAFERFANYRLLTIWPFKSTDSRLIFESTLLPWKNPLNWGRLRPHRRDWSSYEPNINNSFWRGWGDFLN